MWVGPLERLLRFSTLCCDSVLALSLWYKQAPKSTYRKYRFAVLSFLRTAAVLAHTQIHPSTTLLPYASRMWEKVPGPQLAKRTAHVGLGTMLLSWYYIVCTASGNSYTYSRWHCSYFRPTGYFEDAHL